MNPISWASTVILKAEGITAEEDFEVEPTFNRRVLSESSQHQQNQASISLKKAFGSAARGTVGDG